MAQTKKVYDESSIESLSPLEFTRLRPGVYCGSTDYSNQLLIEIVSNAVDEHKAGHGNLIKIDISDDNTIIVEDNGQGFIPNLIRDDGKTVLEASFSVLNTSGKYTSDGVYEGTALGLNGIGSKLCCFLSHWLEVISWRDGKYEHVWFKEGVFEKREVGEWKNSERPSGTLVQWNPSEEFFTDPHIEIESIKKFFKVLASLCPGLKIVLNNEEYYSKNGLTDLVNDAVKDTEIIKNRFNMNFTDGKYKLDLTMTYTENYSSIIVPYVNTGLTESGPHITQFKTIITKIFNNFLREKKWLKEKDTNLTGEDIQEGMYLAFNLTAPGVSYDAQTKSRIVKLDMKPFTPAFIEAFEQWCESNEKEIKIIADKALNARRAREAAKKAREAVREKGEKKQKALKFDSKLADCYGKDRSKCEIYITEGDSASGNLKTARNNEFQAVMPVRGKIINTQKATLDKIQKNAEIMTMIEAFGLTIDSKTMKVTYDAEDLRYGKIIIMSDADVDGRHIKNLFYTFIWNFCPQLILDGYVYAGVPPLYKVTIGKEYKYIKDDAALEEFRKQYTGRKYIVNRLKGLGEMSVEETEETLTSMENRVIHQVTVEDIQKADKLFEDLMGQAITPRKEFIKEYSKEATDII
jgi:DNA gyrase/topoisomerase IV subunit B